MLDSEQGLSNLGPKRIHIDLLTIIRMSDSHTLIKHFSLVAVEAINMISSAYIYSQT